MGGVGTGQVVEPVPARRGLLQQVGFEELVEHPYYRCDGKLFRPVGKGTVKSYMPAGTSVRSAVT